MILQYGLLGCRRARNPGVSTHLPECRSRLEEPVGDARRCASESRMWNAEAGIWRLLRDADRIATSPFWISTRGCERPRMGQRRRRVLPRVAVRGPLATSLRSMENRAQSYRCLERRVVRPMSRTADARAAHCRTWARVMAGSVTGLACSGHRVAAVDVNADERDGLGALARYAEPGSILTIQAGFDRCRWPTVTPTY